MSNFRPQKPQSLHMYSQPHRLHCPPAPGHVPSEHALLPQYLCTNRQALSHADPCHSGTLACACPSTQSLLA